MKIQYASDLHLEFPDNSRYLKEHPLKVVGDILVLAGDIGYLGTDNYIKHSFWDWASANYEQVIACMGNHEFYQFYDIANLNDGFCMELRPNVHCYYNSVVQIDNAEFIISTLWSKIPLTAAYYTEHAVSDFRRILYNSELLTFADFNREHERCLAFLKQAVKDSQAKTKIVLSHHVPTELCTAKEFQNSTINGAFTVELSDYISDSGIDYWFYGHSHRNIDAQIGDTKILSNQLGYVSHGENLINGFDPSRFIEV